MSKKRRGQAFSSRLMVGTGKFSSPEAMSGDLEIHFTVMGGIEQTNIRKVLSRGARQIAMITALTLAVDIACEVKAIRQVITSFPGGQECLS